MASLSTPTRLGRGLVIPGIDTKQPSDKVNTVLSYGGLTTPPSSAHESRRPSLQYNGVSEAPFVASAYTNSQPLTPIHGLNHAADFFSHRWSRPLDEQETIDTSVPMSCSASNEGRSLQPAFAPTFHAPLVGEPAVYSTIPSSNHVDGLPLQPNSCSPVVDAWGHSQATFGAYQGHNVCLGSSLFPTSHGMTVPSNSPSSSFDHVGTQLHDFSYHAVSSSGPSAVTESYGSSVYHQPRVVVPSQLSPQEDYHDQSLSCYMTPVHSHEGVNSSFSSGSMPFNDYEMVRPPSPLDAYFAHSEDEDYLMVSEDVPSPAPVAQFQRQVIMPVRSKRRANRRTRKTGNRVTYCSHEANGCLIDCQGKQCYMEPLKLNIASNKKPYVCKFISDKGERCIAAFDRSEHLKRHEGKHSNERKYPCPLPGCGKRIGRSDNAGDHFKTHLKDKTPGKRNQHFEWPVVHDSIWDNYEDKKAAKKLLDGLTRWINLGMPGTSGSRNTRPARTR